MTDANYFRNDPSTAYEALSEAQRIAFAPIVFQACRVLRDAGVLERVQQNGAAGMSLNEVAAGSSLPRYGSKVLLESGLGIGRPLPRAHDTALRTWRRACSRAASTLLHAVFVSAGIASAAQAELLPLWEAGAGAALVSLPDYRGSDQGQVWLLPFPYIVYRGEFLKADERRVRGLFFKSERMELDASVNAQPPVDSSKNDARGGMPDLDPVVEFGPSLNLSLHRSADRRTEVELRLPVRAAFATDLSYVDFAGWVFQPNVNVDVRDPLGQAGWKFGVLGGVLFSDRRYNQYYYAVNPAFATSARPAYNPAGGYAGSQVITALSKRFRGYWLGGFARWDTLNGAVFAESPLVKTRQYFATGIAVAWIIGESKTKVEATR